jgi:hypothetical protein
MSPIVLINRGQVLGVVQFSQVAIRRFNAAMRVLFLFAWPGAPVLEMEVTGNIA